MTPIGRQPPPLTDPDVDADAAWQFLIDTSKDSFDAMTSFASQEPL